jgi:DNA mismatch repair ATPase MutS
VRERLRLGRRSGRSFHVHPRDEAGLRALESIRSRGLGDVADAVAQAADHVLGFFTMLRLELGFYLGGVNLHERLAGAGASWCVPEPLATGRPGLEAEGLYDVALSLHTGGGLVGNDVHARGRPLIVITGANQGGKSTLLRAIGIAQLMMQSGLLVGARGYRAEVCEGVHTHFTREEDERMEGGKLDEELRRMAAIARRIAPRALLLCNESFSSTNEREGSEIARGVLRAMLDRGVRVAIVTHMYDLAHGLAERMDATALFLRAERLADGRRTFRLVPGEPLATSYAADSYARIFGEDPRDARRSEPVTMSAGGTR